MSKRFFIRYMDHNFVLYPGECLIGRSPKCHFILDDPLTSRIHARLIVTSSSVIIEDLNSKNGVFVNGVRISKPVELKPGDKIYIGTQQLELIQQEIKVERQKTVTFVFCPSCGVKRIENEEPCPNCGTYLTIAMESPSTIERVVVNEGPSVIKEQPKRAPKKSFPTIDFEEIKEQTVVSSPAIMMANILTKLLSLKRYDEAHKLLRRMEKEIENDPHFLSQIDSNNLNFIVSKALKIASIFKESYWLDWIFNLYIKSNILPNIEVVDNIYKVVNAVKYNKTKSLDLLIDSLRKKKLSASEKFILRRLESLKSVIQNIS